MSLVEQVEQIIQPRLSALGYRLRQSINRDAWYIKNREEDTIYVLLYDGAAWHVNEVSGNTAEREQLEKEVRDAIFLGERSGDSDV